MRSASPGLVAFLLTRRPYFVADLFTFTFLSATQPVYRLTSADQDIAWGGFTWHGSTPTLGVALQARDPKYPGATRANWNVKNTLDVPTYELQLVSDGSDYTDDALNIKALAHNGLWDGCQVLCQRAFMPTFGDTTFGLVDIFGGVVGPVQIGARGVKLTIKGANVKLQQFMPRNRYSYGCIHALYDAGCTLARGAFTVLDAVGVGSTSQRILWGGAVPATPAQYGLGYVTFVNGVLRDQVRTIQVADADGFTVAYPFYDTPAPGDQILVTFGCDKTLVTCDTVFGNSIHFRGFPYIPPPTQAI